MAHESLSTEVHLRPVHGIYHALTYLEEKPVDEQYPPTAGVEAWHIPCLDLPKGSTRYDKQLIPSAGDLIQDTVAPL